MIIEGAAAGGISALLSEKFSELGENIVIIISGASVDPQTVYNLKKEYAIASGNNEPSQFQGGSLG